MAKGKNQKLKLLYLRDYLLRNTDEDHGVTLAEITDYLSECDITAERKSLYDDIELLRSVYGMDIILQKTAKRFEYKVVSREFDLHELKLLGDAVESSRFITEKKSAELINKLKKQCSRYEADKLSRQILCNGKVKNMNESIYHNVDSIFDAIADEVCISFKYFNYTHDKQKQYRRGGDRYDASPFTLVYSEDKYYLIAYDKKAEEIRHFRVDRMDSIEKTKSRRAAKRYFSGIDIARYTDLHFSMFGGELCRVRLRFDLDFANAVFDRFGRDIVTVRHGEDSFETSVQVAVSEQFFGWLAGLGGHAGILAPEDVKNRYKRYLLDLAEKA